MDSEKPNPSKPISLEQLLKRGDVWRGRSQCFVPQAVLDTGHAELNAGLLNDGWPLATLVEICQPGTLQGSTNTGAVSQGEWLLFIPALRHLKDGYLVLLNPPAIPFAPALIQAGIDLDRLLVVEAEKKVDFLASFTELARADICVAIMAWQPINNLNYTELRKCQLACSDGKGLYLLFRPISVQRQSSPAALRLRAKLQAQALEIQIFKQKGSLSPANNCSIYLPLPETWLPVTPHADQGRDTPDPSRSHVNNVSTINRAKRNLP